MELETHSMKNPRSQPFPSVLKLQLFVAKPNFLLLQHEATESLRKEETSPEVEKARLPMGGKTSEFKPTAWNGGWISFLMC